jgi:uncharacterized protein YndB with AHSA1/START domain
VHPRHTALPRARWQGSSAEIEARVGGTFRMTMGNGVVAEGRFLELVPGRRVRFTWGWHGSPSVPPGSSEVAIELVEIEGATLLTLTHDGLPPDDRDPHLAGWRHYVPRLAAAAEGVDLGADPGP